MKMLTYRRHVGFPEFLEQNILKSLVGDELFPRVEDGHHVVGILVLRSVMGLGLQERLHFDQVLTVLQQGDGVIFTAETNDTDK